MLIDIFFQFAPSYWFRNYGISQKRDFYTSEERRSKTKEFMIQRFNERYSVIPVRHLFFNFEEPTLNLMPFIMYMGILGAEIKYFDDIDPWAEEPVLGKILSLKEFENFDIKKSQYFKKVNGDFDFLTTKYNPSEIDICGRGEIADIHSPLTIAQKVLGSSNFFFAMMDNPLYLHRVLNKITDHHIFLIDYFSKKKGVKVKQISFGDCVSFALPKDKYEEFGINYKNKIIKHFGAELSRNHSCGKSTHLLESYVKIKNLKSLDLGVETDWKKVKEVSQKYNLEFISFLLNPGKIYEMKEEDVAPLIGGILENNYPVNTIIRTGGIEFNTNDNIIMKIYEQVLSFISSRKDIKFTPLGLRIVS